MASKVQTKVEIKDVTVHAAKSEGNVVASAVSVPKKTDMELMQEQMAHMMSMMQTMQAENAGLKEKIAATKPVSTPVISKPEEVKGTPCLNNGSLHGCGTKGCDKDHSICSSKGKCNQKTCQWRHLVQDPCPEVEKGMPCPRLKNCRHIHTAAELGISKPRREPSPEGRGRRKASPGASRRKLSREAGQRSAN